MGNTKPSTITNIKSISSQSNLSNSGANKIKPLHNSSSSTAASKTQRLRSQNKSNLSSHHQNENSTLSPRNSNSKSIHNESSNSETSVDISEKTLLLNLSKSCACPKATQQEIANAVQVLSNHYLFHYVNQDYIKSLFLKKTTKVTGLKKDTIVYNKDTVPAYFYMVWKGHFKYLEDTDNIYEMKEHATFGDIEITNEINREFTVVAKEDDSAFLAVSKEEIYELLLFTRKKNRNVIDKFITEFFPILLNYDDLKNYFLDKCINIYYYNNEDTLICYESRGVYSLGIVHSGEIDTVCNNEIAKVWRKGDIVGHREIMLLTKTEVLFPNEGGIKDSSDNCANSAVNNIITKAPNKGIKRKLSWFSKTKNVEIYRISYTSLQNYFPTLTTYIQSVSYFIFATILKRSQFLQNWDAGILYKIFPFCKYNFYSSDEVVFKAGETWRNEWICVAEGNIFCPETQRYEVNRCDIWYEKELIYSDAPVNINHNLVAFPETVLLRIQNLDVIKPLLNSKTLHEYLSEQIKKRNFESVTSFFWKYCPNISKAKLVELEKNTTIEKYEHNTPIITQGSKELSKFYMIKSGAVNFHINQKYVRTLTQGSLFGLKAILTKSPTRTASAISNGWSEFFVFKSDLFLKSFVKDSNCVNWMTYLKEQLSIEDDAVELNDWMNIKFLGQGNFSYVNWVKNKKNGNVYSIKAIPWTWIQQLDMYECITNERNVLCWIDHPFIMKIVKCLKNERYVFMLNEYIKGKSLKDVLKDAGSFNKIQAQFYFGSLLIVWRHLHLHNIIHRDIKPDNIMVHADTGYIKLIDFGTAKQTSAMYGSTHTVIGTPSYMAPEVINGESYNYIVDYWSIGVCLYQFICGKLPFGADKKDPMDIYNAVLKGNLAFPSTVKEKDFIEWVSKMLVKSKENRWYGNDKIMSMKWFDGFDWKGLYNWNFANVNKKLIAVREDGKPSNASISYIDTLKIQINTMPGKEKGWDLNQVNNSVWDREKAEKWLENF